MTVAFLSGRRKACVGPVALFLSANVIFFAMESLSSGLGLTTPLQSHLGVLAAPVCVDAVAAVGGDDRPAAVGLARRIGGGGAGYRFALLVITLATT